MAVRYYKPSSGGGAGGAPADAQYVTIALNGDLSAERVLVGGSGIALTDGGANGNATLSLDINELTAVAPVSADMFAFADASDSNNPKKVTLTNLGTALEGIINHDNLVGFVTNEHIDWTNAAVDFLTSADANVGGFLRVGDTTVETAAELAVIGPDGATTRPGTITLQTVAIFENADNCVLTMLSSNASNKGCLIHFGDADDENAGFISYIHSADRLSLGAGTTTVLECTSAAIQCTVPLLFSDYIRLDEGAAPGVAPAGTVRIYADTNGVYAHFDNGSAVQMAANPAP